MVIKRDCFVCLTTTANKVCPRCQCYAHSKCWGKYLKKFTEVNTYLYQETIVIEFPFYGKCPQCNETIKNIKPCTRSDTKFSRKTIMYRQVRNILDAAELVQNYNERIAIFANIFTILGNYKNLLKEEDIFNIAVKRKLRFLYKTYGWKSANMYYYKLYGEQIL